MALHRNEYKNYFKTLKTIYVPRPLRTFCSILLIGFIFLVLALFFVPWVQTAPGVGQITALYPEDRVQTINALVPGRIAQWFVRDGMKVSKGDPIVEIIDNDPEFFNRLESERNAIAAKLQAAQRAAETAALNYNRQKDLYEKGLSAKKDFESAQIRYEEYKGKVEAAKAELNQAETQLSRQTTQRVVAPKDGTILNINSGDVATFVNKGQPLATFFPDKVQPAVELYISGLDAPLVTKGRKVQLIFEGWPAVQFSGWPSIAQGTFEGQVYFVDPALSANGKIRILVTQTHEGDWPSSYFLRFGTRARGWVQLNTVALGYELWRQMNSFPPKFPEEVVKEAADKIKNQSIGKDQ